MDGITDQGQGAKAKADCQLQGREAAVEDHAPAKGPRRTAAVLVLAGVGLALDRHRRMAGSGAMAGVFSGVGVMTWALVMGVAVVIGLGHGS